MKNLLISFSGGRTSAFMTKWIMESEKYKDFKKVVVFANTGKEREETLEFVDKCDKEWELNVVWLEAVVHHNEKIASTFKIVDFKTASRNGEPFEEVIKKYGLPNQKFIHCSRELKINPIHKYIKSLGFNEYYTAIGIRSDEMQRINWENANKKKYIYPLAIDFRINKNYIRKFWDKQCFDLQLKDYEGNCDMCYKKSNRVLMTLILENPNMINWWNKMESKYGTDEGYTFFRGNNSTLDLIDMAKRPFRKAVDHLQLNKKQVDLFDYDLDISGSCMCK